MEITLPERGFTSYNHYWLYRLIQYSSWAWKTEFVKKNMNFAVVNWLHPHPTSSNCNIGMTSTYHTEKRKFMRKEGRVSLWLC